MGLVSLSHCYIRLCTHKFKVPAQHMWYIVNLLVWSASQHNMGILQQVVKPRNFFNILLISVMDYYNSSYHGHIQENKFGPMYIRIYLTTSLNGTIRSPSFWTCYKHNLKISQTGPSSTLIITCVLHHKMYRLARVGGITTLAAMMNMHRFCDCCHSYSATFTDTATLV